MEILRELIDSSGNQQLADKVAGISDERLAWYADQEIILSEVVHVIVDKVKLSLSNPLIGGRVSEPGKYISVTVQPEIPINYVECKFTI